MLTLPPAAPTVVKWSNHGSVPVIFGHFSPFWPLPSGLRGSEGLKCVSVGQILLTTHQARCVQQSCGSNSFCPNTHLQDHCDSRLDRHTGLKGGVRWVFREKYSGLVIFRAKLKLRVPMERYLHGYYEFITIYEHLESIDDLNLTYFSVIFGQIPAPISDLFATVNKQANIMSLICWPLNRPTGQ